MENTQALVTTHRFYVKICFLENIHMAKPFASIRNSNKDCKISAHLRITHTSPTPHSYLSLALFSFNSSFRWNFFINCNLESALARFWATVFITTESVKLLEKKPGCFALLLPPPNPTPHLPPQTPPLTSPPPHLTPPPPNSQTASQLTLIIHNRSLSTLHIPKGTTRGQVRE